MVKDMKKEKIGYAMLGCLSTGIAISVVFMLMTANIGEPVTKTLHMKPLDFTWVGNDPGACAQVALACVVGRSRTYLCEDILNSCRHSSS